MAPQPASPSSGQSGLSWQDTSRVRFALRLGVIWPRPPRAAKHATWQRDLTDLLKQLDSSRREDGVSEKAQFHQMALVYTALLATVPPGEQRWAILARFATFLRGSSIRSESPPEWRQHVLELVRH